MRLLCPHCQQSVAVPDAAAGQPTPCPLCGHVFTPPALTGAALEKPVELPAPPPLTPAPKPEAKPPAVAAPVPAKPAEATVPQPKSQARDPGEPCCRVTIRRDVVRWFAPVGLVLAFVLSFFSWVGSCPNGTGVYTQTAWSAAFRGGFTTDRDGDKVMQKHDALDAQRGWNLWLVLYLLLLIPAAGLAVGELVLPWVNLPIPDAFKRAWQNRQAILAGLSVVLFALLLWPLVFGFGLEAAAARAAEVAVPPLPPATDGGKRSLDEVALRDMKFDVALASFALERTYWLALAVLAQTLALVGTGLALWLERRGDQPEPRIECYS